LCRVDIQEVYTTHDEPIQNRLDLKLDKLRKLEQLKKIQPDNVFTSETALLQGL